MKSVVQQTDFSSHAELACHPAPTSSSEPRCRGSALHRHVLHPERLCVRFRLFCCASIPKDARPPATVLRAAPSPPSPWRWHALRIAPGPVWRPQDRHAPRRACHRRGSDCAHPGRGAPCRGRCASRCHLRAAHAAHSRGAPIAPSGGMGPVELVLGPSALQAPQPDQDPPDKADGNPGAYAARQRVRAIRRVS